MYVKDSIIEARIAKDLKREQLKGRIDEIRRQLNDEDNHVLKKRLDKLTEELQLLQD